MKIFLRPPEFADIETCHGQWTHSGANTIFYIWCNHKVKNQYWYICKPSDMNGVSQLMVDEHETHFRHINMADWHSAKSSLPEGVEKLLRERILKIRCDYEAERLLLE